MELRKINKNDAKAQWEYTTALPTDENGLTNPYNGIPKNMQIDDYIELYKNGGYIKEMRKHVGHAPILTCACGVIIENVKGEILLQKRQDNGCWAIIGGSMEMGETFEETVRRETMEESGLTLGKLEVFKLISGRDRIIEYPNGDVCFGPGIVFITREYEGSIVNDPEEVMEHRFFKRSELPENLNRFDKDIILDWANRKQIETALEET